MADATSEIAKGRSVFVERLRQLRWRFGIALLLTLLAVVAVWLRQQEINRLVEEIRLAGGDVVLRTPVFERLKRWMQGDESGDTWVMLRGARFDDAWMRDHSLLRAMPIVNLQLEDATALSGACLADLLDAHDLKIFIATGANLTDGTVEALGRKDRLMMLRLEKTQLANTGLALLPLEQLEILELQYTEVTASGLETLARCEQLETISLDGRQVSYKSIEVLRDIPTLKHLCIGGPDVNDDVARMLHSMHGIESLWLYDHAITRDAFDQLFEALPHVPKSMYVSREDTVVAP